MFKFFELVMQSVVWTWPYNYEKQDDGETREIYSISFHLCLWRHIAELE